MNFRSVTHPCASLQEVEILGGNPIPDRDAFYTELKSIHETSKLTFDQCVEIMAKGLSLCGSLRFAVRLFLW